MPKTAKRFTTEYANAKFKVTYYPEPDPRFPYEDRIELTFETEDGKVIFDGVRMTFAEALNVLNKLSSALNAFMDDMSKPGFDIPLEAKP